MVTLQASSSASPLANMGSEVNTKKKPSRSVAPWLCVLGAIGALGVALAPHARAMPFAGTVVTVAFTNIVAHVTTPFGNTCNVSKSNRSASAILGDTGYVTVGARESASCIKDGSTTFFWYRFYIQATSVNDSVAASAWCSDMELAYYNPTYGFLTLGTLPRPSGLWWLAGGTYSATFPKLTAAGARGYVTATVKVTK